MEVILVDSGYLGDPGIPGEDVERGHPILHLIMASDVIGSRSTLLRLLPPSPLSIIEEIYRRRISALRLLDLARQIVSIPGDPPAIHVTCLSEVISRSHVAVGVIGILSKGHIYRKRL